MSPGVNMTNKEDENKGLKQYNGGDGFEFWKIQIRAALVGKAKGYQKYWDFSREEFSSKCSGTSWDEDTDDTVKSLVILKLGEDMTSIILKSKTAYDLRINLEQRATRTGNLAKVRNNTEMTQIKQENDESLEKYFARANKIILKNTSSGTEVKEVDKCIYIIKGLDEMKYSAMKKTLLANDELEWDIIENKLLNEELENENENSVISKTANAGRARGRGRGKRGRGGHGHTQHGSDEPEANSAERFAGKCNHCGKEGHKEKDCWSKNGGGPSRGRGSRGKGRGRGKANNAQKDEEFSIAWFANAENNEAEIDLWDDIYNRAQPLNKINNLELVKFDPTALVAGKGMENINIPNGMATVHAIYTSLETQKILMWILKRK